MSFIQTNQIEQGDLIRVKRKAGYYHFGIVSSEVTVIHFSGPTSDSINNASQIKIIETSLDEFLRGDIPEIQIPFASSFSRDEVVKRANQYIGKSEFNGCGYNFISNNCEHFARYCYDGISKSEQVQKGAAAAFDAVAAVAASFMGKTNKNED